MQDLSMIIPESILRKYKEDPFIENLMVTKAGYYPKAKGHSIEREGIEEYIIIYCIEGKGWVCLEDRKLDISKGEILLINKNTQHAYGADKDNPWSIHWAHFLGTGVSMLLMPLWTKGSLGKWVVGYQSRLIECFESLFSKLSIDYDLIDMIEASAYLQQILCKIVTMEKEYYSRDKEYEDMEQIVEFIRNNKDENYTLTMLAQKVGLSKYHFARKFKKYTSYSPMEYVKKMKIQYACDLLRHTDLSIVEISIGLQYNTPQYFTECFKQVTGYSPNCFRKLIQNRV